MIQKRRRGTFLSRASSGGDPTGSCNYTGRHLGLEGTQVMIETASRGAKNAPWLREGAAGPTSDAIRELNCLTGAPDVSPGTERGDILQIWPDAIPLACLYERAK